jgi:hypothetical protein
MTTDALPDACEALERLTRDDIASADDKTLDRFATLAFAWCELATAERVRRLGRPLRQ